MRRSRLTTTDNYSKNENITKNRNGQASAKAPNVRVKGYFRDEIIAWHGRNFYGPVGLPESAALMEQIYNFDVDTIDSDGSSLQTWFGQVAAALNKNSLIKAPKIYDPLSSSRRLAEFSKRHADIQNARDARKIAC
jgi:hypothetical protein